MSEEIELSQWVLGVVVFTRVIYSLLTAYILTVISWYAIEGTWQLSPQGVDVIWFTAILLTIGAIVVVIGAPVWMFLSWTTAAIFSSKVRQEMKETWEETRQEQ